MKVFVSLVITIIFLSYNSLHIYGADSCGSYERYVFKFLHVYQAYLETNIDDLIEEYRANHSPEKTPIDKDKLLDEISSTIIDSANRNDIKLNIVTMTTNKLYLEQEVVRLCKSVRKTFGFEEDDKDFMNDKFILGVKGEKYKDIQGDIVNYGSAIARFISTRQIGDVVILSIKDGKGMLEYRPFNKEQKKKLMENADQRIVELDECVKEIEKQLENLPVELKKQISKINQQGLSEEMANLSKKKLENSFYMRKKIMKEQLKTVNKKRKEVVNSKDTIAESDVYQTIEPEKLLFENPEIILRSISAYILKERCLIDNMPEEMLSILIGKLTLQSIAVQG